MALAKLLHHGVTSHDGRLTEMTLAVEDDTAVGAGGGGGGGGGVRTRAQQQRAAPRLKTVSVFVKIFKLLVYELSNCLESAMAFGDDEVDDDEEDDDDDDNLLDDAQVVPILERSFNLGFSFGLK